jgi:hypothetical protein
MTLGNILDIVLAIKIKENLFWWWDPPPYFPINSSGGGSLHIQVTLPTNELPCSYIAVTLCNIPVTLLDRVTALCEARPLRRLATPSSPGPYRRLTTGYLNPIE